MNDRYKVSLINDAIEDLQDIYKTMALRDGHERAAIFIEELLDKVDSLERFPNRGSIPIELQELGHTDFRQIKFRQYRIMYHVVDQEVDILLIVDSRQNLRGVLDRRSVRKQ
jgi:toxin ParE1/3/4